MTYLHEGPGGLRRRRRGGVRFALRWLAVATIIAAAVPRRAASEEDRNRCGCYRDSGGACFCSKKAICGCPGDCEPRGCEEKRDKELQKEIQAETKKAEESSRSRVVTPDEEAGTERESSNSKPAPAHPKLSPAQARQLAKLLDVYLNGHPGAGGKSLEELRTDLSDDR